MKGKIIGGEFGSLRVRKKSDVSFQIGELLIAESGTWEKQKTLLQVYDLTYGSQISPQNLEMISGLRLEQQADFKIFDEELRNYTLAYLKPLLSIGVSGTKSCKDLPVFFSDVRTVVEDDLNFITKPQSSLFVGNIRSGNETLDLPVYLRGKEVLSHHVLVPATTGRGKSNLVKTMLWSVVDQNYCGMLVLDPHDEYYGRNSKGLKDHPAARNGNVIYYTPKNIPPGGKTLVFNLKLLKPTHFNGVISFSDAQKQAMSSYYRQYKENWIESIIQEKPLDVDFLDATIGVLKRRLVAVLGIKFDQTKFLTDGIFSFSSGETTIQDISKELELGKIVIIDTSNFVGSLEILVGSLLTTEIFRKYKYYKTRGMLDEKPIISVVLEEAPRVLGKEVLEKGTNIFETIAREGRKFKIGLLAITQLPSLIPRQILANMNTKIILGIEMKPERQAIIDSASQDLSRDDRNIASLDLGEAIITSNFTKFAIPVKIPLFEKIVKQTIIDAKGSEYSKPATSNNLSFDGVGIVEEDI
ncbi:ATP-binding protein [Candidatus Woesearchaeota archaeon]|nr:ATP-binding protein [Candidatus Woesearchaeota archaeon]